MLDLSRTISPGDDLSQAYVRITRGCNKFCTYCVVPYTRGPEVHRPPRNIIDEVRKLVDAGARKKSRCLARQSTITATVTATAERRHSPSFSIRFTKPSPDLPRLRFVTSFPRDFTDEALAAMRDACASAATCMSPPSAATTVFSSS